MRVQVEDVLMALAFAVGIAGIVVPILPGTLLLLVGLLVWAIYVGGTTAWVATGVAVGVLLAGQVLKYALPGRDLRVAGVPTSTLLLGGVLAVVGFFVVPVAGLFLGFVLGVYLAELRRVGSDLAWPATKAALKAVLVSIAIELVAAVVALAVWLAGALSV